MKEKFLCFMTLTWIIHFIGLFIEEIKASHLQNTEFPDSGCVSLIIIFIVRPRNEIMAQWRKWKEKVFSEIIRVIDWKKFDKNVNDIFKEDIYV